MSDLPDRHFDTWTLEEVAAAVEGEPVDVMPGSGRHVPGPRRKLLEAMQAAGVTVAGELDPQERDRFLFSLTVWPNAAARQRRSSRGPGGVGSTSSRQRLARDRDLQPTP